jgi:LmbE family N-acetylglucosaminyl deacetylase
MLGLLRNKRILVVAAHPDDEVLGQGATLHKLIRECGCEVHALILGEGVTARADRRDPEASVRELEVHRANILEAAKAIGYHSTTFRDFPDNRFDTVALLDIVKVIEAEKARLDPEVIFTHHGGDLNIDHQRTFEAVLTAARPLATERAKTIISFETPSTTEWQAASSAAYFKPNGFVTVSKEDVDAKIRAMESYELERRPFPHPRSPEALEIQAQRWGVAVGAPYAEAFLIVRSVG